MWWAQWLGAAILVPLAFFGAPPLSAPPLVPLLAAGLGSAAGYFGMLRAFRLGPLSIMTPILASWAVAAWVFGIVWLGERPTAIQGLGAVLSVAGAAGNGALAKGGEWEGRKIVAVAWATLCAVGFGLMGAAIPLVRAHVGVVLTTPLVWGVQWLGLLPLVVRTPGFLTPPSRWAAIGGMASLEALGFLAFTLSSSLAPVTVVSPPASLAAIATVAWCGLTGREHVGALRWGFVLLSTLGTVLLSR